MKATQVPGLIILFFYTVACINKNSGDSSADSNIIDSSLVVKTGMDDTLEAGKVITHVYCKADPAQSYALYIPAKTNSGPLPVIYFFDPHGNGSFPLGKYKAFADTFDFILIGSNNSKNGNDWPETENIWRTMFDDSRKRLKINSNLIYTCGFSGGAKVAGYVALNHNEIKSVIANGAGLPDATPAANFQFSFTAIAGEGDMNMTDLVAFTADLDKTQTRHRILFFYGKHEWAPETTMHLAFSGLQLDAMRRKLIPGNDTFINSFVAEHKSTVIAYLQANNLIKAEQECAIAVSMLEGVSNEFGWFKQKEDSIKNGPRYQHQWQAGQDLLTTEENLKAAYSGQFQQGNMNYWAKTINDLEVRSKSKTPEGAMYQRLLAYLSLAFYSVSNRYIAANQNAEARHFVDLYKIADAANSEAWYFSAILDARNNNAPAVRENLLKAVACGFTDKARMEKQPEFQNLSALINFAEIENKMNK